MKRLDTHIGSVNPAFQERPEVFESVGMYGSVHVGDRVIDDLVRVAPFQSFIGKQFIGIQCRPRFDTLLDFGLQGLFLPVLDYNGLDFPAPLNKAYNQRFVFPARAGNSTAALGDVHVAGLAADESFIDLDLAAQLRRRAVLHGAANPMEHKPRRLLRNLQVAGDFIRANSVLAVRNQPHSHKPFVQANRRVLKDSPDLDGELPTRMIRPALPHAAGSEADIFAPASRADYTARPSADNQVVKAVVGVREVDDCLLKGSGFGGHVCVLHDPNYIPKPPRSQVYSYPILGSYSRGDEFCSGDRREAPPSAAGSGGSCCHASVLCLTTREKKLA